MGRKNVREGRETKNLAYHTPHNESLTIRQVMESSPLLAVTAIARSVNLWLKPAGWKTARPNCYRSAISIWSLLCRTS